MEKAKKPKNKPFKNWIYEDVAQEFGLTKTKHLFFTELDKAEFDPNHSAKPEIDRLRRILVEYVDSWNEDELKSLFINPFISLADMVSPYYKIFTQRPMSVRYAHDTLLTEGKVDFMVAKGIQIPKKPHFFLHEYKPEKNRDNDPCGQLLIAMVASQKQNQDDKPIYGIYVTGRLWFFVILDGSQYAVSKSYSAEDEEVFKIFAMLLHIKDIMEKLYREI